MILLTTSPLSPEDIDNIERLNRIMGPTALVILVLLIITIYILYKVAMAYIENLKDQIAEKDGEVREWKSVHMGMLQGASKVVTVADKVLPPSLSRGMDP